jgi:cell division septation protein DedD
MATNNPGNDPDEDKNYKNSNPDEDFGLPDMEYDELDDDDDDSSDDDSFDSGIDDYNSSSSDDDSKSDFSSKDDDEVDLSTDEIDFSTDYNSDFSNTDSDTSSDYSDDSIYESEDFSDFEPSENADLPGNYRTFSSESGGKGITKFIIIGVIVAFLLAAGLLFMQSKLDENTSSTKIVKVEKTTPEPVAQEPEPEPVIEEPVKQEVVATTPTKTTTKPAQKPAATKQQPAASSGTEFTGTATTLSERTGRAYIVAGSFFDEDMAGDFCKKLISQGITSPFIIPPFNDTKFYRVAIADFGTYKEASEAIAQYQESYGQDIWALKY